MPARGRGSIWREYASVYTLMEDLPFVTDLRQRHVTAMAGRRVVVDAGCGAGLITRALGGERERRVIGVDTERTMIGQAGERALGSANVVLVLADVRRLPLPDDACDGHVSNNVLYCLDHPRAALREAARTTRPGGLLSLSSPRPCMDVEVLIDALFAHLAATQSWVAQEQLDRFVASNRTLQKRLKNLYEPDEIVPLLKPEWTILDAGVTYLDQNFFVLARRAGSPR